jgi:hypothetical protein
MKAPLVLLLEPVFTTKIKKLSSGTSCPTSLKKHTAPQASQQTLVPNAPNSTNSENSASQNKNPLRGHGRHPVLNDAF